MPDTDKYGPSAGQFGPGVIGDDQAKAEAEHVGSMAQVFGPGVLDHPTGPQASDPSKGINEPGPGVTGQVPLDIALKVEEVKELVKSNPAYAERLFKAEMARPDGPRKTALEALQDAALTEQLGAEIGAAKAEHFPEE